MLNHIACECSESSPTCTCLNFTTTSNKVLCEDECILFQLQFLPLEYWKTHKYLVASATMFGSVAVWNYEIGSEFDPNSYRRPVLWEFTGHQGVIYNLRWIDHESLCTTSGDRTVKVWKLEDNPKPE